MQLYPFLGGESDQVDNMRKDGSDNMENKKALDAVNKKLMKNNMPPKIDHGPVDPRSRGQRRDDSVQRRGDVDSKLWNEKINNDNFRRPKKRRCSRCSTTRRSS